LKIYCVNIIDPDTASVTGRVLHTGYQAAAQSHAYWQRQGAATLVTCNVADDEWKPVDKRAETRLNRVAVLWDELMKADPDGLDALLDDLVKRVSPKSAPKAPVLSPIIRGEAEALLKLDRLVDAG
jgi:hypothetical protein